MGARWVVLLLLACLAAAPLAGATTAEMGFSANPIRKVVNMLQSMQKKVTEEGEKAQELFDKFMCYCKKGDGDLTKSIKAAEAKIAELVPAIEAASSKKAQLEKDLKSHDADKTAAMKAMAEATAIRGKDKAAFDKEIAEGKTNLVALKKAVAALEKGMGGSFLQTRSAEALRGVLARDQTLVESDREEVLSFLAGGDAAPQGGEVVGILKQMGDEMSSYQKDMISTEDTAVKNYDELMSAKKKEVIAITKSIEEKLNRVGDIGVELATMKNDLKDSTEGMTEDKAFLADMDRSCKEKSTLHEEEKKMRAEEIVALADTIKVLNDDDALELFKKTLPSSAASFLQLPNTEDSMRADAKEHVDQALKRSSPNHGKARIEFISLALRGRKVGMEQVIALVDKLITTLTEEQGDDDAKQVYCMKQLDKVDDKKKDLERKVKDLGTSKAEMKEAVETITEEIKGLKEGIKALDASVAEATMQRKAENAEFKQLMSDNGAAKELILFARKRLSKFYHAKAFAQMAAKAEDEGAPPPPPATMEAYTTKAEESGGVMAMMDVLVQHLDKEMTVGEKEEKHSQEQYERAMTEAADKRALDAKTLNDKDGKKADLESSMEVNHAGAKSTGKDLADTKNFLATLHGECDWLLQNYDARKQARADEMDSLVKAKAVLSGADYSFLQLRSAPRRRKNLRLTRVA